MFQLFACVGFRLYLPSLRRLLLKAERADATQDFSVLAHRGPDQTRL